MLYLSTKKNTKSNTIKTIKRLQQTVAQNKKMLLVLCCAVIAGWQWVVVYCMATGGSMRLDQSVSPLGNICPSVCPPDHYSVDVSALHTLRCNCYSLSGVCAGRLGIQRSVGGELSVSNSSRESSRDEPLLPSHPEVVGGARVL